MRNFLNAIIYYLIFLQHHQHQQHLKIHAIHRHAAQTQTVGLLEVRQRVNVYQNITGTLSSDVDRSALVTVNVRGTWLA